MTCQKSGRKTFGKYVESLPETKGAVDMTLGQNSEGTPLTAKEKWKHEDWETSEAIQSILSSATNTIWGFSEARDDAFSSGKKPKEITS